MIYILILLIIGAWFGVFFGGKRYLEYREKKQRIVMAKAKIKAEQKRLEEVERINREVEIFAREQRAMRVREEKEHRELEVLRQSLNKKDFKMYAQANGIDYVRGGHGNKTLLSFEYGWTKGDIDDKDSQG